MLACGDDDELMAEVEGVVGPLAAEVFDGEVEEVAVPAEEGADDFRAVFDGAMFEERKFELVAHGRRRNEKGVGGVQLANLSLSLLRGRR